MDNTNGIKLWNRAKISIPGGNNLLTKRPERYAPDLWPTYFSKAKGCNIWDLDDNLYVDIAQMGVGTAILGYSHDEIDSAVKILDKNKSDFALLHCTSTYPCPLNEINLSMIPILRERYSVPVGYSGHEIGLQVSCAAVTLGATFVERHITLD